MPTLEVETILPLVKMHYITTFQGFIIPQQVKKPFFQTPQEVVTPQMVIGPLSPTKVVVTPQMVIGH